MSGYLALKYVHVLSAAVLLGTGAGIAYFLLAAHLSRNLQALRVVTRHVILADWLFTAPAVLVQPVTGVWMMIERGWPLTSRWFIVSVALYVAIGACWVPVVFLQYRMARLAQAADSYAALPPAYHRAMRCWMRLGAPAFAMVLALYAVMLFKPWL